MGLFHQLFFLNFILVSIAREMIIIKTTKQNKIQNIKYKKQEIATTLVRSWWDISNKHPIMNITAIIDSQHL